MSGGAAVEPYSLGAQCISECVAMAFTIYLGEAIIANELLAKTKGQKMGWGFVAFGFGLSFGVVIFMFGFISSHINPATCLALWVMGKISGTHFLALSASEFVGAFIGAVLVWLHYLPHFKTVPEPPAVSKDDLLLRSRDALPEEALSLVSYDTREDRHALRLRDTLDFSRAVRDLKYYFRQGPAGASADKGSHDRLLELALGPEELKEGPGRELRLRRHSVQVCDVHRRLDTISPKTFQSLMNIEHVPASPRAAEQPHGGFAQQKAVAAADGTGGSGGGLCRSRSADLEQLEGGKSKSPPLSPPPATPQAGADGITSLGAKPQPKAEPQAESLQSKLYRAAIVADQNAKLSIFATRPAIYTPVFNFICEFMCTTALIFGAVMMFERNYMIYEPSRGQFDATEGFYIGMFVFVVVLGLGGPTGIAANPARDFSPRLAHFLLPIPGKGSSEWYYSWVPFMAPFAGGAAAGGLVLLFEKLNHSQVPAVGICPSG